MPKIKIIPKNKLNNQRKVENRQEEIKSGLGKEGINISDEFAQYLAVKEQYDKKQWDDLKKELQGLKKLEKYAATNSFSNYQQARLILYEALLPLENNIEERYEIISREAIRKSGQILWDTGGMSEMRDSLLWFFIPTSCHRMIDHCWNNIGDWRS
jgi:uncharacterized protein with HEPN domain